MKTSIKVFLLIISLLFSFSLIFWGVTGDTFYWLNRTHFYQEEPFTALTIWIIKIWVNLTQNSLLSLRILGWITCIIAICIPYFSLLKKTEYAKNLHFLSIGIILFATGTFKLFNPDTTTVLCLSLIFTLFIKYQKKQSKVIVLFLGIIIGFSIAFRFPNIVVLPFVVTVLFFYNHTILEERISKTIAQCLLIVFVSLIVYYIIISFLCNTDNIFYFLLNKIKNPTEGAATHSLSNILKTYKNSFINQVGIIFTELIIILLIKRILPTRKTYSLIIQCLIFLLSLFIVTKVAINIFALSAILLLLYSSVNSTDKKLQINICFIITLSFVGIAGSDTGIAKIYPFMAVIMPVFLVRYTQNNNLSTFKKGIFITFLIYTVIQNIISVLQYKSTVDYSTMKYIHVSKSDAIFWNKALNDIKVYPQDNIIFYGVSGHAFYTITQTTPIYNYSFWMYKNDEDELNRIFDKIKNRQNCLLVDFRKNDSDFFKNKIAINKMRLIKSTDRYNIYLSE